MFGAFQPPSPEETKQQLRETLLDAVGMLEPVYDAADGMKAELERRGWSPTMAEEAAGAWLTSVLAMVGRGGQ